MRIHAFARCAAFAALMVAPLVALADNDKYDHDKDRTSDESQRDKDKDKSADESKTEKAKMSKLTGDELQIVAHVHNVNQLEIDLGKLAEKHALSAAVKDYGKMLVNDHQQNDKDLNALVKKHDQKIPKETLSDADKTDKKDMDAAVKRLKGMKGADFDREFINMMVQGHEKELVRADSAVAMIQASDLKTFVNDMKPVLQRHADQARDLQKGNPQASIETPQMEPNK